jgi:hypothetical protein
MFKYLPFEKQTVMLKFLLFQAALTIYFVMKKELTKEV